MLRFDLPFSRYSRSNGQNLGPQFRIWGYLGEPLPKGEKTCPGPIRTIMPNFTPIGATVADICNRTKKKTANLLPCHTNIWRVTSVLAKHSTRHTGVDKFRIWGFLGGTFPIRGEDTSRTHEFHIMQNVTTIGSPSSRYL